MSLDIKTPGEFIQSCSSTIQANEGTYVRKGAIYSSVVGKVETSYHAEKKMHTVQVNRDRIPTAVPEMDAIVIGKVIRVNPTHATLSIVVVGNVPCAEPFQGIIRLQDVRATERDKVVIYDCFRPGDIVRAQVVSLGDARSYYLSTAQNELGVILAQSVAGCAMIPISWDQMICPKTKVIEHRKCAKPQTV